MNRYILFFCLPFAVVSNVYSQIGGLSASKLATNNPFTVEAKKVEFEPSFYINRSVNSWSDAGKKIRKFQGNDSAEYFSAFLIRFTYGFLGRAEIGAAMPVDLSGISLGAKVNLLSKKKAAFSLMAGINLNKTEGLEKKNSLTPDHANAYVAGATGSLIFSEKLSVDIDLQFQRYFDKNLNNNTDFFADTDIGYYAFQNIQLITGFNYSYSKSADPKNSQTLIFNPGFTDEQAKNFILVLSFPITVYGKNSDSFAGVYFALTITLD